MLEIFNIILIIVMLVIIYYFIKYNNYSIPITNIENNNSTSLANIENNNSTLLTNIENNVEKFEDIDTKYINFNYDIRPIDKKFIKEQTDGAFFNTWYPNTWIESIDENGKPIYNSRDNITAENILNNKPVTNNSYEFNKIKTENISGILKPEDNNGKTIKEIYDNSMVDYKKLEPVKNKISDESYDVIMPGGSNLSFFASDTWTYENENPENGGLIYDNIYGNDPISNNVSVF